MGSVYPELKQRSAHILTTIRDEQDRFMTTLGTGETLLQEELKKLRSQNKKEVPGETVFKLYDTYGFPADLTRLMANEQGFTVDEKNFDSEMESAREKAKASWKGKSIASDEEHLIRLAQEVFSAQKATLFAGYESLVEKAKILALSNGKEKVSSLKTGQTGILISDKTPFYGEGGGQIGDNGWVSTSSAKARVFNTTKQNDIYFHHVEVESGEIKSSDSIELRVDQSERSSTASNHSATHLLHAALRKTLGTHVTQAGSLVDAFKLRFDFTHNKALSSDEISTIEKLVNTEVGRAENVQSEVLPYKEAITKGAMALFGEKYGDQVRVLKMGDFSTELCGGTHVKNTAQIRLFKIVSESGVSSGVRRIEAITGDTALQYFQKNVQENQRARSAAGISEGWQAFLESKSDVTSWIEDKKQELKSLEREIKKIQGGQINVETLIGQAKSFKTKSGTSRFVFADVAIDDRDVLAQITDQIKNKIQSGIVIVVGKGESSHPIIVSVSKDLNPEFSAGNLLKEVAAIMGGKGGGRPDFAQGAAPNRGQITEAEKKAQALVGC
jgi:alanyl-tRNA synthetase